MKIRSYTTRLFSPFAAQYCSISILEYSGTSLFPSIRNFKSECFTDLYLVTYALDVSADDLLVENLTRTSSPVGQELHGVLQDCNHDEKEMLIRLLKFMKELFREFSRSSRPASLSFLQEKTERISFTESSPYSSTISSIFQTAIFISKRPCSVVLSP